MPFYLAWIYSNFSRWNFKFFSISDLSYGINQDFMPFIQAQFFVSWYPQKLLSATGIGASFQTHGRKHRWMDRQACSLKYPVIYIVSFHMTQTFI